MEIKNLFKNIPQKLENEYFNEILRTDDFILEQVVFEGHVSPEGFWFEHKLDEFILLLSGSAELEFENETVKLNVGDYLVIPSHKKHRVKKTDPMIRTLWLTIYYKGSS